MSLNIDNLDDLRALIRKLDIKVKDVEELKGLLTTINAQYNPDAARAKVAKLMTVVTAAVSLGVAGMGTFITMAEVSKPGNGGIQPGHVAILAIVWGVAALVTCCVSAMAWLMLRQVRSPARLPGDTPNTLPVAPAEPAGKSLEDAERDRQRITLPEELP
jgi:hypothetical protein